MPNNKNSFTTKAKCPKNCRSQIKSGGCHIVKEGQRIGHKGTENKKYSERLKLKGDAANFSSCILDVIQHLYLKTSQYFIIIISISCQYISVILLYE